MNQKVETDIEIVRASDWDTYKRLLKYVKGQWFIFVLAVIGFIVGAGAEAYAANVIGQVIDAFNQTDPKFWLFPVLIFGSAIVRALGAIAGELLLSRISFNIVHRIRCELFERLLVVPSNFFEQSSQGELVSRLTFTAAQLRDTATDAIKIVVQDGAKLFVFLGGMVLINWKLTGLFLIITPLVAFVVRLASKRFRKISQRIQISMGDVTHVVAEAVTGFREIRTFGGDEHETDKFTKASDRNRKQNLKMVATKATSAQIIQIFVAFALALLIGLLLQPGIIGVMTEGQLVTYLTLAGLLASPIKKLSDVNARLQRGLAAAHDVFQQIDHPSEIDEGQIIFDESKGLIQFDNVSFSYDQKNQIVNEISLTIEPGQTVALVGPSGAGKTTIASLIPRFYDAQSGSVLIDGKSVMDYQLTSLRQQIAIVSEQVTLFNDTLLKNIAYGSLANSTESEVRTVLDRAQATEFVENLPDGLDTLLGDNGALLSGGQRQRVAIARALLKNAPILILDEATSALDTETERHVQQAIAEVVQDRTTIVIAHRLSTIESADLIAVVDGGRIIEQGTHSELLAKKGAYSALYEAQFEKSAKPQIKNDYSGYSPTTINLSPESRLVDSWYSGSSWLDLFRPFSSVFGWFAKRRRVRFEKGVSQQWKAPIPVVVVGNITVGGTGKTPLTIFLSRWLTKRGFKVGLVSRGYGGRAKYPLLVSPTTDIIGAGDEAVILARRSNCPVVVDPDRVRAVKKLVREYSLDVVISDDGLQHYALNRDIEIAVIDGERGVGNGRLLPSGPLREPISRLSEVDWVVSNGTCDTDLGVSFDRMCAVVEAFVSLSSGRRLSPSEFSDLAGNRLIALAGIGNPMRFKTTLETMGFGVQFVAFDDHHEYKESDIRDMPAGPIVVTEKDAEKIRALKVSKKREIWYAEIAMSFDPSVDEILTNTFSKIGLALK